MCCALVFYVPFHFICMYNHFHSFACLQCKYPCTHFRWHGSGCDRQWTWRLCRSHQGCSVRHEGKANLWHVHVRVRLAGWLRVCAAHTVLWAHAQLTDIGGGFSYRLMNNLAQYNVIRMEGLKCWDTYSENMNGSLPDNFIWSETCLALFLRRATRTSKSKCWQDEFLWCI